MDAILPVMADTPPRSPAARGLRRERLGPWRELIKLPSGRTVLLRPIDPRDAEPLRAAFATLSPEEVRFRFMHPIKELTPAMARELTVLDDRVQFALAVSEPEPPGEGLVGAVARAAIDPATGDAEFAIIVARPLSGQGLGTHLLRRIIDWCRKKGVRRLGGDVLVDNHAMLHLADKLGFTRTHRAGDHGVVRVERELGRERRRAAH